MAGFLVACQPPGEDPAQKEAEAEATRAAVNAAGDAWAAAFKAGDLETIAASYTADAVAMPPDAPTETGREAVAATFEEMFAAGSTADSSLTTDEIGVGDDWAFRRGHFTLVIQPEEGDPATSTGKFIEVWRKGADGTWRISRDIWNMDAAASGEGAGDE
jgi:uncharacterized protein (TIGR02246 family)